jgi:hypothetical protein
MTEFCPEKYQKNFSHDQAKIGRKTKFQGLAKGRCLIGEEYCDLSGIN